MKRNLVMVATVVVAAAAVLAVRARGQGVELVDGDCPGSIRYPIALNVSGGSTRLDDIALIDVEGRLKRLTNDHASFHPSFSPDGSQIAFVTGSGYSTDAGGGFEGQAISVMDIEGGERRLVTNGDHSDSDPAWSPDGDAITFVRDLQQLMVVQIDGGQPELIYEDPELVGSPQWSSDGDTVTFLGGDAQATIYTIAEEGGPPKKVASRLGDFTELAWAPDGDTFAYVDGEGIFTLTPEEPNPKLFVRGRTGGAAFSPDGHHLLYRDEDSRLTTKPVDGGQALPLGVDKEVPAFQPTIDWLNCP